MNLSSQAAENSSGTGYAWAVQVAQPLSNLLAWFSTMRQVGGYGGPVAHWWSNRYRFTGPGLDWRYEGILIGLYRLWQKTGDNQILECLSQAAQDLITGQLPDGTYRASRFELNPGTLGTPHEAAATLGLVMASPVLDNPSAALETARRNLDNLIAKLYRPSQGLYSDRVPNKLCTLAQALLAFAEATGAETYLDYARAALDQSLAYQLHDGPFKGGIHQYAPEDGKGDLRFFPYYQARCIPPLVEGARLLGEPRYLEAAREILGFVERTRSSHSWPMVLYPNGKRDELRFWAGMADILLAFHALQTPFPEGVLQALLASQTTSGAFPTFWAAKPDYRARTPVAGWNDKMLRLLAELLEENALLPQPNIGPHQEEVMIWGQWAALEESSKHLLIEHSGKRFYEWDKQEPWAKVVSPELEFR